MFKDLQENIHTRDTELCKKIVNTSEDVRKLYNRITDYLSNIFARGSLTEDQAEQTAALMGILSEIDRIGSLCAVVANGTTQGTNELGQKLELSEDAKEDLMHCVEMIQSMYTLTMSTLKTSNQESAQEIIKQRESIVDLDFQMRKAHIQRVSNGECKTLMTKLFNNILHGLNRMENSCINIAEMSLSAISFRYFLSIEQHEEEEEEEEIKIESSENHNNLL
jgi:phosphate:Na+ symporter